MESIGQLTVDTFGSLAIPHEVCEQLGFTPGETVKVEKGSHGEVWLKPVSWAQNGGTSVEEDGQVRLVEEDGLLLIEGIPAELLIDIVERERETRMNEILKGSGLESFA